MLVTCPTCQSIFKLPDNNNPNLKMRCSICSNIFALREIEVLPDDASLTDDLALTSFSLNSSLATVAVSKKRANVVLRIIFIILFALMFLFGMLWNFTTYVDPIKGLFSNEKIEAMQKENKIVDELFQRVRHLELAHIRQFVVPNSENEKFEKITVIEGKVINNFDDPRSFIELEATLFDADGNPLGQKTQMAGPKVSFFQLQVLGETELEQSLRDKLTILDTNTNVQPKQSVPFMFLFYNPPSTAVNFNIKIVGADIPEKDDKQEK